MYDAVQSYTEKERLCAIARSYVPAARRHGRSSKHQSLLRHVLGRGVHVTRALSGYVEFTLQGAEAGSTYRVYDASTASQYSFDVCGHVC